MANSWAALQNEVAGVIYLFHSASYTALTAALLIHFLFRPFSPNKRRWDTAGAILFAWFVVTGADASLSLWFAVARWLDRPDWMYFSWWPIVFRGVGVAGMVMLIAMYARGKVLAAALAFSAIVIFLASPLGPFLN
jgi:FtsH-binding integral membrane protein